MQVIDQFGRSGSGPEECKGIDVVTHIVTHGRGQGDAGPRYEEGPALPATKAAPPSSPPGAMASVLNQAQSLARGTTAPPKIRA